MKQVNFADYQDKDDNQLPRVRLRITDGNGIEHYNAILNPVAAMIHLGEGRHVWYLMLENSMTMEIDRHREVAPGWILRFMYNYIP